MNLFTRSGVAFFSAIIAANLTCVIKYGEVYSHMWWYLTFFLLYFSVFITQLHIVFTPDIALKKIHHFVVASSSIPLIVCLSIFGISAITIVCFIVVLFVPFVSHELVSDKIADIEDEINMKQDRL